MLCSARFSRQIRRLSARLSAPAGASAARTARVKVLFAGASTEHPCPKGDKPPPIPSPFPQGPSDGSPKANGTGDSC